MTSNKAHISISLDLVAEISRSAEAGIEQLKAQQVQQLAKARLQVQTAEAGIEQLKAQQVQQLAKARLQVQTAEAGIKQLKAYERDSWSYKIWQLCQISSKLR